MKIWTMIGCLTIALLAGCSSGPDPNSPVASMIMVQLPGRPPLRVTGGVQPRESFGRGQSFEIANGKLIVNDKDYGTLQGGEQVKIEADGKVTVNGQPRQPGGQ